MKDNRFGFPDLRLGILLRTTHYNHILSEEPDIGFFEILTENYLDTGGRPLHILEMIAERYRIVMHGVWMSIGSTDPINFDYLAKVKVLAERTGALWISDDICWTGVLGRNTHDLLRNLVDDVPLGDALATAAAARKSARQQQMIFRWFRTWILEGLFSAITI